MDSGCEQIDLLEFEERLPCRKRFSQTSAKQKYFTKESLDLYQVQTLARFEASSPVTAPNRRSRSSIFCDS